MSITRRQFLLGTAAGLILPSFYEKAFSYFENHGEPLLLAPPRTRSTPERPPLDKPQAV